MGDRGAREGRGGEKSSRKSIQGGKVERSKGE